MSRSPKTPSSGRPSAQAKLAALDTQYQAKIMGEVERYQELAREKELLTERWDQQNSLLVESHERVIQELTQEFEQKLQVGSRLLKPMYSGGCKGGLAVPPGVV